MEPMYRFALRPAWLVSHLLVLAAVVAMVNLGAWQLRRHDERQDRNALVEARAEAPALDAAALGSTPPEQARFRSVDMEGPPVEGSTVAVDNRSLDGRPGAWILTAVELAGGEAVMVNRGFQHYGDQLALDPPDPPRRLRVDGTAEVSAARSCPGRAGDAEDIAFRYGCVDLDRMAADLDLELVPVEVRVRETAGATLRPVPPPELDSGPHLSYAVQWFVFTTIALVGYPLVLHRVGQQRRREARADPGADTERGPLVGGRDGR